MSNKFSINTYCDTTCHGDDVIRHFEVAGNYYVVSCDGVSSCTSGRIAASVVAIHIEKYIKDNHQTDHRNMGKEAISNAAKQLTELGDFISEKVEPEIKIITDNIINEKNRLSNEKEEKNAAIKEKKEEIADIDSDINNLKGAVSDFSNGFQRLQKVKRKGILNCSIIERIMGFMQWCIAGLGNILSGFNKKNHSLDDKSANKQTYNTGTREREVRERLESEIALIKEELGIIEKTLNNLTYTKDYLFFYLINEKTDLSGIKDTSVYEPLSQSTHFKALYDTVNYLLEKSSANKEYPYLAQNIAKEILNSINSGTNILFLSTVSLNIFSFNENDKTWDMHKFSLGDPEIYIYGVAVQESRGTSDKKLGGEQQLNSFISSNKGVVGTIDYSLKEITKDAVICIGSDGANLAYDPHNFHYEALRKQIKKGIEKDKNVAEMWHSYLKEKDKITDDFSLAVINIKLNQ